MGGQRPVPVGEVALVATFGAEGLFKGPDVISVPGKEVGSCVNGKRLVHVRNDKVIVAVAGSRGKGAVRTGGEVLKADNGIYI